MNIQKINEHTKVKDWVNIINELVDNTSLKSYVWETKSQIGKSEYRFENDIPFPIDSKFSVTYASIELYEEDYTIYGDTLTFVSPTLEENYPIKIRYIGSK